MFTGIITDIGKVDRIKPLNEGVLLRIETVYDPETIELGASIACSGVCLTVVALPEKGTNARWFEVEAWEEALRLTTISTWENGTNINLERSLKLGDEMGGHLVSGHVDGVATVVERRPDGDSLRFTIAAPPALAPFIAQKGSVTLDGVSLTVNEVDADSFGVNVIPITQRLTTFGELRPGDRVNLEIDMLARYVARLLERETA